VKAAPTGVTWTGRLPDDQFDDFALLMKLPAKTLPVEPGLPGRSRPARRARAVDGSRRSRTPDEKLSRPAPVVTLIPADTAPAAAHHH
jgi:hypothetical protein